MEYLIKASVVIALFYLCFYLFLKKETFFQHNRWFLITGLIIALIFPLIVIPVYIPIEPIAISEAGNVFYENAINVPTTAQSKSVFEWAIPIIYSIGLSILFIQFLLQFGSLILLLFRNPKNKDGIYTYVIVQNKISPFSFFKWIVYNPTNYNTDELQLILTHEKVHANQMHSIDILFTQLACVVFWFNPLIWLYRKEVRQNLEYIADSKTQNTSKNIKEYQHLLLKTSVANHNTILSNNFYNSSIKKRIIMLNKSRSNRKKQWKYILMLPLLAGLLLSMNTEEVYIESETTSVNAKKTAQNAGFQNKNPEIDEKDKSPKPVKTVSTKKPNEKSKAVVVVSPQTSKKKPQLNGNISATIITKNTTDSELNRIKDQLKKEGLTAKFKGIKRNKSGEIIALKVDVKSKESSASYNVNSNEPIATIKIVYDEDKNSISIGNGHKRHGENTFVYEVEDGNHQVHTTGNGSHVYVVTQEEHEHEEGEEHEHHSKIHVKCKEENGNVKRIKRTKNVEEISGDDNEVIEIIIDEDNDNNTEETIIVNSKKTTTAEGKEKDIWISNDSSEDDLIIIKNSDANPKILISDDENKKPLYIVDGKEVTKDEFSDIKPDSIESINVLKGKSAIKKYGDKGKDGVIEMQTKKKN